MGTVNVLEAARSTPSVAAIVNVTSDKATRTAIRPAHREDEPMGGHDPYSSSKGAAELVAARVPAVLLRRPDGPPLASARAGNVIGGGDWSEDRLLPDFVPAALDGRAAPRSATRRPCARGSTC